MQPVLLRLRNHFFELPFVFWTVDRWHWFVGCYYHSVLAIFPAKQTNLEIDRTDVSRCLSGFQKGRQVSFPVLTGSQMSGANLNKTLNIGSI